MTKPKVKKPGGFFEGQDNSELVMNQKEVITAKHLDSKYTGGLSDEDFKLLDDEYTLPQSNKATGNLSDQDLSELDVEEIIHQTTQETAKLDGKTSKSPEVQTTKRSDVEHLNSQMSRSLDVIPLEVQTPSQLEVKHQGVEPTELQVDETLKPLSDAATKPLDGETPKKKKAKSASLVKKTYYIDHDLDGAIELMAVLQKGDQSDIVRQLLRSAIPEYYLTQWKVMSEHSK